MWCRQNGRWYKNKRYNSTSNNNITFSQVDDSFNLLQKFNKSPRPKGKRVRHFADTYFNFWPTSDFIDIKRTLRPTVVRATIDEPHHEILLAGSSLSSSLIPLTSGTAALAEERRHDYDDGGSLGSTASTTRPLLSQRPRRLSLSGMLKDTKHFLFGGRNGGAI